MACCNQRLLDFLFDALFDGLGGFLLGHRADGPHHIALEWHVHEGNHEGKHGSLVLGRQGFGRFAQRAQLVRAVAAAAWHIRQTHLEHRPHQVVGQVSHTRHWVHLGLVEHDHAVLGHAVLALDGHSLLLAAPVGHDQRHQQLAHAGTRHLVVAH